MPATGCIRNNSEHTLERGGVARYIKRLRSLEGAIPKDSRYLATVRRAT
jgi:hypothetical protein